VHVVADPAQVGHEGLQGEHVVALLEAAKVLAGQDGAHTPPERSDPDWHDRHDDDDAAVQVTHDESQDRHTSDASAYVPAGQLVRHTKPSR